MRRNLDKPKEDANYSEGIRPEKPELRSGQGGTTKYGDQINGSYKQPWVEHDGVTDHQGDMKD